MSFYDDLGKLPAQLLTQFGVQTTLRRTTRSYDPVADTTAISVEEVPCLAVTKTRAVTNNLGEMSNDTTLMCNVPLAIGDTVLLGGIWFRVLSLKIASPIGTDFFWTAMVAE